MISTFYVRSDHRAHCQALFCHELDWWDVPQAGVKGLVIVVVLPRGSAGGDR